MLFRSAREEKKKTIEKLYELFGAYKQIVLTTFTNVGSHQIQLIRKMLRPFNSQLVISKNTLIKKALKMRTDGIEEEEFEYLEKQYGGKIPELKALTPLLKQKIALIFTEASIYDLKGQIESNKIPTEARIGTLAPIDFTVPAGPTGLDPSQINFFHALNISTKIVKGQIEITKDFKVTTKDKKVKASEAALLKKLNFKPFEYGMKVHSVYDDGSIIPPEILTLNPASLLGKFEAGTRNIVGLSMSAGITISATIPLIIGNAFKNIAALSLESGYKIKELENMGSAPAAKTEEKKKEEPKKEVK